MLYALMTRVGVPTFFGLWTRYEWTMLAKFHSHDDAVRYAYNVVKFDSRDQFIVHRLHTASQLKYYTNYQGSK